ncbi:MAG: MBL fold metallo-hydrolase [Anaerolineales bacterium]|nr:MBL fold metallo-hydrolase [Anaerolineales bacterium]
MDNQNHIQVKYRWLGVAGIEIHDGGQSLLIDPYVTRVPWHHMFFWHVQPDRRLINKMFSRGDYILVTHAHIDHLLDVPTVIEQTGASAYGSQNTCRLLKALGVNESKIHCIESGEHLKVGNFDVSVFNAWHFPVPFFLPGTVPENTKPPRTARQYRMDACFSYLIKADGMRILVDSGKREPRILPAEVLVIHPLYVAAGYRRLIEEVQPKLIIPNHWDNFMPTISKEINKFSNPPDWLSALMRWWFLPLFSKMIKKFNPNVKVLIPQPFHEYDLREIIE